MTATLGEAWKIARVLDAIDADRCADDVRRATALADARCPTGPHGAICIVAGPHLRHRGRRRVDGRIVHAEVEWSGPHRKT